MNPVTVWLGENTVQGINQCTPEWHAARKNTIGGSSIASIIGQGYQSAAVFLSRKVGLTPETFAQSALRWGKMFEPIAQELVTERYDATVYGSNSFILGKGEITGLSYSPDGIGRANSGDTILFEFKCPYTRIPTTEPPHYYVPQVLLGLSMIDIVDYGILAEFVFRRVPFGAEDRGGSIALYMKSGGSPLWRRQYLNRFGEFGTTRNGFDCNDLSCADDALLDAILADEIEVWYGEDLRELRQILQNSPEPVKLIGAFSWKLITSTHHRIERVPDFAVKCMPRVRAVLGAISACESADSAAKERIVEECVTALKKMPMDHTTKR